MPGLVVEGGAFRGAYTDGALDALIAHNIEFPYIIGVSAGISNAYSYASKQFGRNWKILEQYRGDKRYLGARNFLTCKSLFGLDFIYDEIPNKHIPFDYEALRAYPGKLLAGVTNARTGKAEYFEPDFSDRTFQILRATCALPLFFPVIRVQGKEYYDGGMADPIPIRRAIDDGNRKNLIILTREPGYRKTAGRSTKLSAAAIGRRYPALKEVVLHRHIGYNKTVALCEKLEQQGQAVILRPCANINVGRFEGDIAKLRRLYEAGYADAEAKLEQIRGLF